MIVVNATPETLIALRDANALLRKQGLFWSELPPTMTEDQLVAALLRFAANSSFEYDLATYRHYMGACGCLGPQNGDPLCGCSMSGWLEAYRFEVALEYLKQKEAQ